MSGRMSTRDMSALRAVRAGKHGKHVGLLEGRGGTGDESTGSDFAGFGQEDHLVARLPRSSASVIGICGVGGSATKSSARMDWSSGDEASLRPIECRCRRWSRYWDLPGEVLRSERAALSREARGGARHRLEPYLRRALQGPGHRHVAAPCCTILCRTWLRSHAVAI